MPLPAQVTDVDFDGIGESGEFRNIESVGYVHVPVRRHSTTDPSEETSKKGKAG